MSIVAGLNALRRQAKMRTNRGATCDILIEQSTKKGLVFPAAGGLGIMTGFATVWSSRRSGRRVGPRWDP